MFENYLVVKTKDNKCIVVCDETKLVWFVENVHDVIAKNLCFADAYKLRDVMEA